LRPLQYELFAEDGRTPMASEAVVVRGNLEADGTLTLDSKPGLPAGPVEVTLRPLAPGRPESRGWLGYLRQARAELEAAGHPFRTKQDIDADLAALRADCDEPGGIEGPTRADAQEPR
jgi:hypothetical protein